MRFTNGGDHAGDLQAFLEGRPDVLASFNSGQKILRLDDDLILITGAVAGPLAKGEIVRMFRPRQDLFEPTLAFRAFGAVEPNGVLILLIEADRTLGAIDFIGIAHLPAGRDAAEEEMRWPMTPLSKRHIKCA